MLSVLGLWFCGCGYRKGCGEKMWTLPTRWGGNPLNYLQKAGSKESYSVMSVACSVVQFSHMCCGRSLISYMHELQMGAGINGKTCEGFIYLSFNE